MKMKTQVLYKILGCLVFSIFINISTISAEGAIAKIWSNPAAFTPSEEVTFYFDVSDTDLAGNAGPLYLWTWQPSDPVAGNGDWGSSPAHMACTQVEGNIWSFTMVPATFYGVTEIPKIEGLLKTQDGSKQTDNFDEENGSAIFPFDFNKANAQIITTVPSLFKMGEPMSIILNVAMAYSDGGGSQGQLVGKQPSLHSGINGWSNVVESGAEKTLLKKVEGVDGVTNVWKIDIIPSEYWGANAGDPLNAINCLFNDNGDWAASGRDVGGENFELVPIDPNAVQEEFYYFPGRLTADDVLSIYFNQSVTEVEELAMATELFYIIQVGGTTLVKGQMKRMDNGIFMGIMIPSSILPADVNPSDMTVIFQNSDGSVQSAGMQISTIVR